LFWPLRSHSFYFSTFSIQIHWQSCHSSNTMASQELLVVYLATGRNDVTFGYLCRLWLFQQPCALTSKYVFWSRCFYLLIILIEIKS
jgi:hypothetical protein